MSRARGIFEPDIITLNLNHLIQPGNFALPSAVNYQVPPELANKFRDASGWPLYQLDPRQTTTLAKPLLASLLYLDVGLWAGDGPSANSSDATWGRRRDFGVVCGRLALLCSYKRDGERVANIDGASGVVGSQEFKNVKPLLDHLSSRASLGRVVVTKALLGRTDLAEAPTDKKIHVFLGDLHAPVMTDKQRTYSGVEPHGAEYASPPVFPAPYGPGYLPVKTRDASEHPMFGRYEPGLIAGTLLPYLAAKLQVSVDDLLNGRPHAVLSLEDLSENLPEILALLGAVWAETSLDSFGSEKGSPATVEHWFEQYHGAGAKGAEIFEGAGADLKDWLGLLIQYQRSGKSPPIRLAQLGDLFDLWMGLKCAFTVSGASHLCGDARSFAEHWCNETEYYTSQRDALHMLLKFDDWLSPGQKVEPIFLYGNHDNYRGTLFGVPAQFKDTGLVAQHGHQGDPLNSDGNAQWGYLLTQAAFAVFAVRLLEDPMSALLAIAKGGIGPRLTFTEMALEECVFKPILAGVKPTMTFVMGHTHEPILQEIRVLEYIPANPPESPPPPAVGGPTGPQCNARATIRFREVYLKSGDFWNMRAITQPVGQPEGSQIETLLDEEKVNSGQTVDVSGSSAVVAIQRGDRLEIMIQGWAGQRTYVSDDPMMARVESEWNAMMDSVTPNFLKPTPKGGTMSVQVRPYTWGGTRTMACEQFKVTFSLVWDAAP